MCNAGCRYRFGHREYRESVSASTLRPVLGRDSAPYVDHRFAVLINRHMQTDFAMLANRGIERLRENFVEIRFGSGHR